MLVRSGGTGFSVLGVFALPADLPDAERTALATSLGIPAGELTKLGERTVEVSVGEGMPAMHLALHKGLLLLSPTAELVDEARSMADKAPEPRPDALERARSSWGAGADAHLLIHTARAQRILGNWFLPQEMERLALIEGWVALDLRARPDHVLLSGILAPENDGDTTRRLAPRIKARFRRACCASFPPASPSCPSPTSATPLSIWRKWVPTHRTTRYAARCSAGSPEALPPARPFWRMPNGPGACSKQRTPKRRGGL